MDFNESLPLIIILALTVGLVLRQLMKWRELESTSRKDDAFEEENEELRRGSESTSTTDYESGEENKDSNTNNQMKRKRNSEAILSMETKPAYQYDVFLSFCGGDTRLTFTDNLYYRMRGAGICVFLDSEELKYGKRIGELLKAVDESQIYIPIFSQKFASRSWCLREVACMVECHSKSDGKRDIIPIFYDVEPNDVKLITDLYKNDILKHKHKKYRKPEELEQWTRALKEVGSMMGLELKGKRQGQEIESIVKEVLHKLNGKHMDVPAHLIEDYRQIKAIIEKLDINSGGVRFVGIHGIGGIGKTTLAKVVFKKLSSHFDRVSFLNDVRQHDLVNLQKKLLSSVGSAMQADRIQGIGDGMYWIERLCHKQKVLIILDDLDKKEQLEKLAGKSKWFGLGSRILITTRNEGILTTQVESSNKEVLNQPRGILRYEVHQMELDQALKLFYKHAFRSDSPLGDYVGLSKEIVDKLARLPLAVEVIGSFLHEQGFAREPHGHKRNLWKETLKRLDNGPWKDVRDALKISWEGLEEQQKEVFLDIACFFTNEDHTYPVIMWDDCNYYPESAIGDLCLRSLIKIRDNKFWMHDQVRDLGRQIILEEHPHKCSRVWTHKDAIKLPERKEKYEDVKALSLTSNSCSPNFGPEVLTVLPNLRFLRVKCIDFFGNLENNYHFSNLIMLDLSDSNIEDDWGGWSQMKVTKNLKVLNLTSCKKLTRTPDFSNFKSLEMLILAQCPKLITIDCSIGKLEDLKTLNIKRCGSLAELPEEVGSLHSLTEIVMPQNFKPLKLPEGFGNLKSLSSLKLDHHPGISQLPKSIGGLVELTHLSLIGCVGIKELPLSIGKLKMLLELDVSKSGIGILPNSIGELKNLRVMRISYTVITKLPCTISGVEMLEELHATKCSDLTSENLEELGSYPI